MNSYEKYLLARAKRMWIEQTHKIHLLNYWYYRYFTNEFILFCIQNDVVKE